MRVLVCGQRTFAARDDLFEVLDALHALTPITCIIEGEAPGADTFGREWAEMRGVPVEKYPANWKKFGRAAGPIRNKQMIDEGHPDMGLAFYHDPENSKGTKNMVHQLQKANIPCEEWVFPVPPTMPFDQGLFTRP